MDNVTFHILTNRANFLKDHNLKYLEFAANIPANLAVLKEIGESLPQGKRREQINEIITYFHNSWQDVLKDYNALQEGSTARNIIEDMAGTLATKESEIKALTEITQNLTNRLRDANA